MIKLSSLIEDIDPDRIINKDDLTSLKKIYQNVNRQDVIEYFNSNDIDYYGMSDLKMYIIYIDKELMNTDSHENN